MSRWWKCLGNGFCNGGSRLSVWELGVGRMGGTLTGGGCWLGEMELVQRVLYGLLKGSH